MVGAERKQKKLSEISFYQEKNSAAETIPLRGVFEFHGKKKVQRKIN